MKKFFIALLAIVMCAPTLALVGCNNKNAINMERYFTSVEYRLYPKNESFSDINLKSFTDKKADNLNRYTEITFKGARDWLFGMIVEKITFEIFSNETKEIQFTFKITNLRNGDPSATSPTTTLTRQIPVRLVANKAVPVAITDINDYFVSQTADCNITLSLPDGSSYFQDTDPTTNQRVTNEFKYDILNFQVFGHHKENW